MKKIVCILFCFFSLSLFGDNLRMSEVKLLLVSEGYADLEVKLTWSNSWHNLYNYDGVYLFGKFRTKPAEGWHHIFWSPDASVHTVNEGYACEVLNGGRGLIVYPVADNGGTAEVLLRIRWNFAGNTSFSPDITSLKSGLGEYNIQGLETVYVPTSPFYAGDGTSSGRFSSPGFGIFPPEYDIIGTNSNFTYSANGSESSATYANRAADRYNQGIYNSSVRRDWCGTAFPAYWTVDFKTARRILYFGVSGIFGSIYNAGPSGVWYLEGSTDNKAWIDVWNGGPEYWSESVESYPVQQVLRVERPGDYRYYRIRVDASRNAGVWNNIRISNVAMSDTDLSSVYASGPVLVDGLSLPLPSGYPSGVRGFYAMKYELTQEQYVNFLNQLPRPAQYERTMGGYLDKLSVGDYVFGENRTTASCRNGIVLQERNINNGLPYVFGCDLNRSDLSNGPSDGQSVACNYLSVNDMLSYADWAGLRPLSELEYEKMCRGSYPGLPVGGEYAWEGTSADKLSGLSEAGTEREHVTAGSANVNADGSVDGPVRAGLFVRGDVRRTTGNSFWGISDLSGNLSEIYCNAEVYGRQLKRSVHGGGEVGENGAPLVSDTDWPRDVVAYGVRGGDFRSPLSDLSVSDRSKAIGYFSDFSERKPTTGVRLGITVEPSVFPSVLTLESGRKSGLITPYDTVCGSAVYTIRGDLPLGNGVVYQYAWLMSKDDGSVWRYIEGSNSRDLEIRGLQEMTPEMVVKTYLYKRVFYSSSAMGESGVVGLTVGHGYRLNRLRDTLRPCMSSPGFEVTTPLNATFSWYGTNSGKILEPVSTTEVKSRYALLSDDFRTGKELASGLYGIELRIRVAGNCEYREKLEVHAIPRTSDPFPAGDELFSYDAAGKYKVSCTWGGEDTWRWKVYSDAVSNRIEGKTGVISGKVDTMCRITVGLVCEACPDVEWKKELKETRLLAYTGSVQSIVFGAGDYVMECWGGQGGTMESGYSGIGGKGGYTQGMLTLDDARRLYIYIGGQGEGFNSAYSNHYGGWNGGGDCYGGASGGGGATDIRLTGGSWNTVASLQSRIMVAAGGGGSNDQQNGGAGGGLVGGTGVNANGVPGTGGSQTAGGTGWLNGSFGLGAGAVNNYGDGGSGGSGYYGGGKASGFAAGGGGGSSFISGHAGCNAIDNTGKHTGTPDHFSGLIFKNTSVQAGARSGKGQVKITYQ